MGGLEAESSAPDSPKTRFINKATGSSLGGSQHHILLLWHCSKWAGCCLVAPGLRRGQPSLGREVGAPWGQRWAAARGNTSEEQSSPPAFSLLFLVENPRKSPSSPSDWGTHSEGEVFADSFSSLRAKSSIWGRQGRQLQGKWPNTTICGGTWLLEKRIWGSKYPHEGTAGAKITTNVCTTLHSSSKPLRLVT